jgi:hypothetical protein
MENTKFRTTATELFYKLLKRKSSLTIAVPLLKLAVKTLGENTHIIETEAIDIISQLEKWLSIVEGMQILYHEDYIRCQFTCF